MSTPQHPMPPQGPQPMGPMPYPPMPPTAAPKNPLLHTIVPFFIPGAGR